ncbi:MAG TPA: hypothetical protein VH062_21295 [Polyangiaceae bacterium]|jgi:hypothetical protein|nr:hypothetical protein [Polyangiaceae bacterium]
MKTNQRFISRMRFAVRALAAGVVYIAFAACSDWPGVSKNGNQGNNSTTTTVIGTCSGTPLPCGALAGGDCTNNSGCMDLGSCSGTPVAAGFACGAEITFQGCNEISGCVWSPNCIGTPLGTCAGVTQTSCLLAKGCSFTPASTAAGAGGSTSSNGTSCTSYAARCTGNSSCDCGYSCITQCATCASVCGHGCQSDLDCVTATGPVGEATPYCTGVTNPPTTLYPGVCADAR